MFKQLSQGFLSCNCKAGASLLSVDFKRTRRCAIPDVMIHSNAETNSTELIMYLVETSLLCVQ